MNNSDIANGMEGFAMGGGLLGASFEETDRYFDDFYALPVHVKELFGGMRLEERTRVRRWLILPDKPTFLQKLYAYLQLKLKKAWFAKRETDDVRIFNDIRPRRIFSW